MKKLLPILLLLLSCCHVALSQDYPVQVTTIVTPPYSLYLSDYASPESNTLQVMLQLKELDRPEYRVKLRITIEGQGISLRTKATFVPRAIVLQGGVPEMLTGADLSAYLNPNNMDFLGTTQQAFMRTGMFPEGFYTFKVEVLDYVRNVVVSNAGVGNAFIILNDPPLINLPFNNDKVIATDPQNIIFSWTPRHTASPNAAFSTEYEFTLVELYPDNRNPNDAIRAANSIYTTTTSATSLNYGIIEPLLIPGRKYAFRIRAYDVSGKDLFKNNGYSEVNVFQFGDACVAPLNVKADPLDPVRIKFSWEQQDVHTSYSLEFRKEGTSNWEQQSVINDAVIVPGLLGNTTYEYRVQGQCGSIQGPFSTLATVITPASDTSAFVCGAPVPEIEINTTPLDRDLRLLDIIKTADFEVIITDLTANGDGSYKGTGRAMVPWFKLAGIRVKFSNIKVNQDLRVFSGNVTTIYSKDSRFVLSADLSSDDPEAPDTGSPTAPPAFNGMDTVLTVPITNVSIPTGNNAVIVVTTPTGQTFEIPRERNEDGTFRDTRITDANGDTWTVKSGGDIQRGPNVAPPPAYASRDSVNFRVNFAALENQYYGFDSKHFQEVAEDKININGEDYWIAWKSVESGRQDYVSATASGQTTFPAKVGFKTSNGPALHETGSSAGFRRVSVMGLVDQQVETLTAYVRVQEGQNTEEVQVGRLNVKAYDKVQKKVIVVPVNNASVPAASTISEQLNKIYAQAVVGWEVVVEPSITVDEAVIQNLDVGVSDMLSSFPENMLSFVRTFRNDVNRFIDGDAYYIFMVNNPNAGRAGFMPFNRKFGFVYTNKSTNVITTLAHELGHGAFNLRHTFSPEAMLVAEGTTDNLMDYNNGTKLKKYQWDLVRNQETINGWFEDDSESAYTPGEYFAKWLQQIRCAVISNLSSLQLPEDFKSGALSQTVVFDYGLPGQEAEINGLKIRSATWTITDRNALVSNILQPQVNAATGEIIYQNFKIKVSSATYNNNSGVSPFEHFRRYLMPQNVDEVKNEFNQVVNRLTGKSTLTDLDINYIKAIASCGSKYFSPLSKYKIIRKISDHSLFITEYYEDLILDLLETYQGDVTLYSAEMLRLLKSDHLLLKRLFYNMSNESGQVFKNGSEENFTRFLQVLFGLWVNTPLADQSKYLYDDFIPIGGNQYTPHVISYNGDTWFPRITYENYRFTESGLFIDTKSFQGKYGVYKYDFFQPVTIIFEKSSVTKITRLEVPAIYFAGQTRVDNLERTLDQLGLTVDVALTVSGVGNITKLRHLSTLRQFGKVLLGTIELTSGAADIILNYSNYCYGNEEFCETFREYNTYIQLGLLSCGIVQAKLAFSKQAAFNAYERHKAALNSKLGSNNNVVTKLDEHFADLRLIAASGESSDFIEGVLNGVRRYNVKGEIANGVTQITRQVTLGSKSMSLKWNLVDGFIDFTSESAKSNLRSQIKNFLGIPVGSGVDAHHILPLGKCDHPVVQAAAKNGYHPNLPESIIGLEHYDEALQVGLHQNHPNYDKFIEYRLERFKDRGNLTPESCNDFIQKELIPELKTEIFNAKNSVSKNLDTYFKEVVNPIYNIQ